MTAAGNISGVFAPVLTPFKTDLSPDTEAFIRHCLWLAASGAGLAVFGTNSEANSLSVTEKRALLDALQDKGLPSNRLLPGTGCCALTDTVELTRHAVSQGAGGVLMLPPFYYKGVSDDGLYANFAEVIERVADDRLRIYLYHIPQVSQVPISLTLIERLLKAYPGIIAGIKDSSGDWSNTEIMLEEFQPEGFDVFAGSEVFLLRTLRGGGAGCITATGNVNPLPMLALYRSWQAADADAQQAELDITRGIFQRYPMIPAMKVVIAGMLKSDTWKTVRPPLTKLNSGQERELLDSLEEIGFRMLADHPC